MLQRDVPDDYVIATGVSTSLEEYVRKVFEYIGLNSRDFITQTPSLKRPSDIDISYGDAAKAEKTLNWKPKVQLPEIISRMLEHELSRTA